MGDIDAIFAFAIAFVFYGAGPLYLASERKKLIRKLQYWIFCVLYDAIIFIVLQLITGNAISLSGLAVAMLIFGTIFYFIGLVILRKRGMVAVPSAQPTVPQPPVNRRMSLRQRRRPHPHSLTLHCPSLKLGIPVLPVAVSCPLARSAPADIIPR